MYFDSENNAEHRDKLGGIMLKNLIRMLVYAGAIFAPRNRATHAICLILPLLAILAVSGSARAQTGYCVQKVGEDGRGTQVRLDGARGCDMFQVVRQFPRGAKDGSALLRQEQLRSIWAANVVVDANGGVSQPTVKRSCTERTPNREPGTSEEENKVCEKTGGQAFYYALPGAVFLVPMERALTPVELGEQKKAQRAEQERKDKQAAAAAERQREESEAFKRVHEMEQKVVAAEAKTADAESRLASVADKEWRVKALPPVFGLLVLAAAWGILSSMGVAALRFKYRALTVDGYGYLNPLEATKDMLLKLASAREEMSRVRYESEVERAKHLAQIHKLGADLEAERLKLGAKLTQNADLIRENQGHKRTIESMKALQPVVSSAPLPAAEVLSERCADLDAHYRELDEKHRLLKVENTALKLSYNELEEAHRTIYQVRDRQARMLLEANADKIQKDERIEALENQNAELRGDYGRLQALVAEYESSWSNVLRASNRPPAIAMPYTTVTSDETPTTVRGRTLPIGAAPPAVIAAYPEVTSKEAEPEEIFASLFQELVDTKRQRDIFRGGFLQIESFLSWQEPANIDADQLEERVKRVVAELYGLCRFGSKEQPIPDSAAPSSGPLPTATQSDIVRIERMSHLLDGQPLDASALRGLLADADPLAVADCLKACVHEWSVRSDRETMIYAVHEPFELHDLNRLLCSRLVCGPDISLMVPEGFAEAVDRVHLAYAPAFSRRAVMRSVPPPAMPQASG